MRINKSQPTIAQVAEILDEPRSTVYRVLVRLRAENLAGWRGSERGSLWIKEPTPNE